MAECSAETSGTASSIEEATEIRLTHPSIQTDSAIEEVASAILNIDPDGSRMARVIRATFDQMYDGQRTGRYKINDLHKTEKTHFGTLVEINLQREFKFNDGKVLDFSIAGHEVDCKYSHTGQWMLPIEIFDQIALVFQADDQLSIWNAGLIRVTKENRRNSENRDRKTGLNKLGRSRIRWLHHYAKLQPNALLQLPASTVSTIMGHRSGQERVNSLFRLALNRRLTRNIIATVAQQEDYMKRVRYNGGARSALRAEGIIILGGDYKYQTRYAADLGATLPHPGEFVSVRVAQTTSDDGVYIDDVYWRLATDDDHTLGTAPVIKDPSRQ